MKTVIMAGGKGSRIASLAPDIPKPLIPIAGRPVLEWEIEILRDQGFTDVILTVSHMAEKIISYFGDGSKWDTNITYYKEEQPLGNAGAVFKLWKSGELEAEDAGNGITCDFLLLIADAVFDIDFHRFVNYHRSRHALATLFTHPNSHPYDSGLVIADENSHIINGWLSKEDKRPLYYKNRVNAGLHILNTELLSLTDIDPASVGKNRCIDLDRDILKPLVSSSRIFAYDSSEYVKDMGTPERFRQVCADLITGRIHARNLSFRQRAVFLDLNSIISRNEGFTQSLQEFKLLPGAAEAVRLINDSVYLCIIAADWQIMAHGKAAAEQSAALQNKLETLLGKSGAYIERIYDNSRYSCVKLQAGMMCKAEKDFNLELPQCWVTGSMRNIQAGKDAGCKSVFISACEDRCSVVQMKNDDSAYVNNRADYSAADLQDAVRYILDKNRR